ncbi:similar to Saccharomyces cerevisiae YLR144C ACF2 Intracellular beta-1,3-endoglucanase, expression is induced during sporulation [Maudiozyma saulgeensis]|uniref:glucan endo-1,3-beta-D-glucosidase n=1 Tax=Maudiozyma saulgeensis TaxID=1789683 RepID=A0A1X7R542_9SACH|nr:similar to Saccharomyces cerevisiae YLR144C ACF2 Intracellular beta-1,3-endoglucanase, expression is induced during sporulation [Kazachstania saulgeensis]
MSYNRPPMPPHGHTANNDNQASHNTITNDVPPPYSEHDTLKLPPPLPSRPLSPNYSGNENTPPLPSRPGSSTSDSQFAPALPTRPPSSNSNESRDNYSGSNRRRQMPPPIPARSPNNSSYSLSYNETSSTKRTQPSIPSRNYETSGFTKCVSSSNQDNTIDTSVSTRMEQMTLGDTNLPKTMIDFSTPISTMAPPSDIFNFKEHPIPLPVNYCKTTEIPTVETNKFYGNMFLGQQRCPIWTHPYSLWLTKELPFIGIATTHIREEQRVFDDKNDPPQFFFSPTNIKTFVFSSIEFTNATPDQTSLNFSNVKHMSVQLQLKLNDTQFVWFPIVQGMGFVTAIYYNLTPSLQSAVGYRSIDIIWSKNQVTKYHIRLENDVVWTLYVTSQEPVTISVVERNKILADRKVNGCIFQLVADTNDKIDLAASCYQVDAELKASILDDDPSRAHYSFNYETNGISSSGKPLLYALPHHFDYLTPETLNTSINSQLASTVYGRMSGLVTDNIEMEIVIPNEVQFEPFSTIPNRTKRYSNEVLDAMSNAARKETQGDVINESNLDSMYFSGKVLAKYAWILYCCHFILKDKGLVSNLLDQLKGALQRFIDNKQILPLVYDITWGGLISSGNESQDFGNPYYNDHHFHYSYHVIAAAIVAKVDEEVSGTHQWLERNREWVELLIRDYANPSVNDPYFPVFRSFDWYNGHSWAKGLFESGDGKDEESSSEDVNASYALKLWGLTTHNQNLINIADIQLGILKTSLNKYFLYQDNNTVEPLDFIRNKVSGILFENKIDHTTYFGNKIEYIQMIHSIPIIPPSSFIRSPVFVREEWEQILKKVVDNVNDGWKGIIMLNVALFDPDLSYRFFSEPNFNVGFLDNGQSLTWSLAFCGAYT